MNPLPSISQNPGGLHHRYNIEKADGTPVDPNAEYFVLRLDRKADPMHREACLRALAVYAANIAAWAPQLAAELRARYELSPAIMSGFEQAWQAMAAVTHATNIAKGFGFGDGPVYGASQIALMHAELSEALEGLRECAMDKHLPHRQSVEVELADVVIRIMNYAAGTGLDVAGAVVEKAAYNRTRPHKHGGKQI